MGEGEDAQAGSTKGTKSLIHSWVRVLTLTHHMGEGEDAQASSTNGRGIDFISFCISSSHELYM